MAKKKKTAEMIIRSLGDVVELVNQNTDIFESQIKKLRKSNRGLKIFNFIVIGCAIYSALESRKRDEELYRLSVRVRKLENKEGE